MSTHTTTPDPGAAVLVAESVSTREADRFEIAPIDRIQKSDTNPRRRFDESKDKELAASIRQVGVLEPLLVRPYKSHVINLSHQYDFDLIAGERRLRGAKDAGLTHVPVIVKDLSEKEVLCIQIIENHQRQDVHPLDEGEGFERLIRRFQYTPKQIAEEIGSDESYVYKRVKLLSLIDEAREHFYAGRLTLGHYLQLARLDEGSQREALNQAWHPDYRAGRKGNDDYPPNLESPLSLKEFTDAIKQRFFLSLKSVPWDKTNATFHKKAGACNVCPKRTGANALLFDDTGAEDNCLDAKCFRTKGELHLVQVEKESIHQGVKLVRVATSYADGKELEKLNCLPSHGSYMKVAKADHCDHTQRAVVVHGDNLGKQFDICTSKKCKRHMAKPYSSPSSAKLTPDQKKAAEAKQFQRDIHDETEKRIVDVILRDLPTQLGSKELQIVAADLAQAGNASKVAELMGWTLKVKGQSDWRKQQEAFVEQFKKATTPQQTKAVVAFVLVNLLENGGHHNDGPDEDFAKVMTLYGLKWKTFEAKVREELAPADKEQPKVPPPTKKATAKKAVAKKTAPKAKAKSASAQMAEYATDPEPDYDEGEPGGEEDFE